jgi:hypothetical protein
MAALALILIFGSVSGINVSHRLKRILAIWFVLQIVLPFTAPVHTCDLGDLLGLNRSTIPMSATTPMAANEAKCDANSFVSPIAPSTLRTFTMVADVSRVALGGPVTGSFDVPSSPQVLQTVVRV